MSKNKESIEGWKVGTTLTGSTTYLSHVQTPNVFDAVTWRIAMPDNDHGEWLHLIKPFLHPQCQLQNHYQRKIRGEGKEDKARDTVGRRG